MKKFVLTAVCLLSTLFWAYAQGINFQKLSYEETLSLAKREKKGIFVDVYTTWCGPCKRMAAEVFSDKKVGDFMNTRFVSLKLDAENEATHGLFKKYKAQGFPTFFWLTAEGDLMDVKVGYLSSDAFIQASETAIATNLGQKRKGLEQRWNDGERSYQLVMDYVYGILGRVDGDKVKPAVESYLSSLTKEEIRTPENSKIIAGFISREWSGKMFHFIVDNVESIEEAVGYIDMKIMLYRMYIRSSNAAIATGNEEKRVEHLAFLQGQSFPQKEMYMRILAAETDLHHKKYGEALDGFVAILKDFGQESPYLYREFSYSILSSGALAEAKFSTKDKKILLEIGQMVFELGPSQETLTYLSAVYAATGDYKKAYESAAAMQFYQKPVLPGILFEKSLGVSPKVTTSYSEQPNVLVMKAKLTPKQK